MDTLSVPATALTAYTEQDRELDLRWWAAANYLTVAQIYLKANVYLEGTYSEVYPQISQDSTD
jgi:xylulose-5-phosphate/fructose-6-phosphate phosphoketolase